MAWNEVLAKRTRHEKVFQDSVDPTKFRAEITIEDQHYHDGSAWQEVDESFVAETGLFEHQCVKVRHAIHIGATGTRRWCPRRNYPNEYVEFGRLQYWNGSSWANVNLGTATRANKQISWSTANFDLSITNNWHKIKIEAVLKTEAARRRLRWAVSLNGLTWDNWTLVSNADSEVVGYIDKPLAWDATSSSQNPNVTITNTYADGYVEFGGDLSGAVLPITIDPTFTDGYGGDTQTYYDTYLRASQATTNFGTSTLLVNILNAFTSLIRWDLSSISASNTCDSATCSLFLAQTQTGDGKVNNAYELAVANADWTEAGATWNTKDGSNAWAGSGGAETSGTDYNASVLGTFTSNSADAAGTEYAHTYTAATVKSHFGGYFDVIYKGAADSTVLSSSDHATTGWRPKLVVEYTAGGILHLLLLGVG